jgi:TonB-linked SusC/RagA family outer membrane protein
LDYRRQESDQFQAQDTKLKPSFFRAGKGNTASVNNSEGYGYTIENVLTYDKEFNKKHRLTITGLYSVQQDFSHNTFVSKDSIDEDFIQFYNLGQSNASNNVKPSVSGGETTWGLISYMARANYVYDNRFMFTATGRVDGSSRLAEGNKYHSYPALSAGWIMSNEKFMKGVDFLSLLKLRAGWGETSNQSISPYASLGNVGNLNDLYGNQPGGIIRYNYGPTIVTGYNVLNLPNPSLDWEYTRTFNIGLDFAVLKNRITGTMEYYNAQTNNILYGIALPPTSGITRSYVTNIGQMANKGFELTLSSVNINSNSGFRWTTDMNIFWNRNKLLALTDGFTQNIASQLFIGQPLTAIYDYTKLGIWQKEEAQEAARYGASAGSIKLADLNGDGKIDANNDRSVIGNSQADWQGGMTNRFSYKNFDFSFMLYARFGGTLVSQVYQPYAAYINVLDGKRNNMLVNYWTPNNASNDFPAPSAMSSATLGLSTLGYYDASFVKMRSINLGYTFDDKILKKISAQSIRLYLSVQNPFVLYSPYMKMGGLDPEATGTGNQGVQDPGNISGRALTIGLSTPPTRSFNLGLNITF